MQPANQFGPLLGRNLPPASGAHDLGDLPEVGHVEENGQFAEISVLMDPATRQPPESARYDGMPADTGPQQVPAVREYFAVVARQDHQFGHLLNDAGSMLNPIRFFVRDPIPPPKAFLQIDAGEVHDCPPFSRMLRYP